MPLSGRSLDVTVLATCACAFMLFGYDQGVLSGLVGIPSFLGSFGHPTPGVIGTVTAIYDIGCVVGSLGAIPIGDRIGRRKSILLGGILIVIGAALQASSFSIAQIIVARIITGLGNGINATTVPVYQAEMCRAEVRGAFIMTQISFVILGIVAANWIDYAFVYGGGVSGSKQWRLPIAIQTIFPIATFFLIPLVPESPRFLASQDRTEEVVKVIALMKGKGATEQDEEVQKEAQVIIDTARYEKAIEGSWTDIFKQGEQQNLRRMVLGASSQWIQEFTGINALAYYGPAVYTSTLSLEPRIGQIVGGCGSICFWLATILGIFTVERLGRRWLAIWGLVGCAASMIGLCVATAVGQEYPDHVRSSGFAALAFVMTYYFAYGISWNTTPWIFAPEINSLRMRNRGAAIASASEWMSCFIIVEFTPSAVANLHWRFYLIFIAISVAAIPFCYICYPETGGVSLEGMDKYFEVNRSWNVLKARDIKKWLKDSGEDSLLAIGHKKMEVEGGAGFGDEEKAAVTRVERAD